MREIAGGVTSAKGFEAAGAEAAVKYKNRKDMALVYSTAPCKVAGTYYKCSKSGTGALG